MSLLNLDSKIYVAGHKGMVGGAILRRLSDQGFKNLIFKDSRDLDLTNRNAVFRYISDSKPDVVVLAAAKVGGILANNNFPADFISKNLQIQVNVMDASAEYGVERLLFMGSSCIYPKFAPQPIREEFLLDGPLEKTNEAYAIAKIAGLIQVQSVRKQFGLKWISAMPTNLYGPGDTYSELNSHVIPSLIMRYSEAKIKGIEKVTNWGSGSPRREFLHVDDLASASVFLLENYDSPIHINVGSGTDMTIKEISEIIAEEVGFVGETFWDEEKPDGTPRKLLDVSKLASLGWSSKIDIRAGIRSAIEDFQLRSKAN